MLSGMTPRISGNIIILADNEKLLDLDSIDLVPIRINCVSLPFSLSGSS